MAVFPTLQGGGREVGLPLVGMLAAGDVICQEVGPPLVGMLAAGDVMCRDVGPPLVGMLATGDVIFNVGVEPLCKSDWILHDLVPRGQLRLQQQLLLRMTIGFGDLVILVLVIVKIFGVLLGGAA